MTGEATLTDGSQAPIKERPMHTQKAAPEGYDKDPRAHEIEDISERFERQRKQDLEEAIAEDPGLAARQKEMDDARDAENDRLRSEGLLTTEEAGDELTSGLDDGAADRQQMHPISEPEKPALPTELREDPLADYIEMIDGKPMFRMKVDGDIVYKDLDSVRTQEQKQEAADRRLQAASEWQKELQTREAAIIERERKMQQQPQAQPTAVSPPSDIADVDDLDINAVSKEIVTSMFSGTEEEAAQKLASTLGKIANRSAKAAVPQQQINADELVQRAKQAAREEFNEDQYKKDVTKAWNDFTTEFKDVHDDPEAFAFADSQTGRIEAEHPDWGPQQVMMEAGKRARDVVIKSKQVLTDPPKVDPTNDPAPDADRQQAKSNLRPLPKARTGVQPEEQEVKPQTPSEALAEIRASRNQPT